MSNYIVLVKQVPDVTQITDNAFDPETGTLIRSRLASVINELDAQALAFANRMKLQNGDGKSKIVALTMGPPMAAEVLRYSLARCVDTAVLLTDRALGGADTVATANPLAHGIRKIVSEIFNGDDDYYIVSGMQSVDGDTAQVPPQIAEELSIPCVAYATDSEFKDGRFEFTRIISGGSQTVAVKKTPAIVTVAKYEYPVFAAFATTRKANRTKLFEWTAEDVDAVNIGVKGSKTRVIRVFPPPKSMRKCQRLTDAQSLADILADSLKKTAEQPGEKNEKEMMDYVLPIKREGKFDRSFESTKKEVEDFKILADILKSLDITDVSGVDEETRKKILDAAVKHFHKKALEDMFDGLQLTKPAYTGQVWVVAEHNKEQLHPAAFELVGKARELADCIDTKVGVCLAGHNVERFADELIAAGADDIYLIEDELLAEFDPTAYRKAISDCVKKYWPQIVLFAATPQGRMLAPMISYRVGCGLTADCTSLDIRDSSRKGQIGILFQTRPALGGNVMATICTKDSKSQMATARPGVMERLEADTSRSGKVVRHQVQLSADDLSFDIISTDFGSDEVNFGADIIVSGGRGMQTRDNFEQLLESLCGSLSAGFDMQIEKGASRVAVEQGFVDRAHQVGQTGTSVGPKLYIAMGISGAIQHMIGVANAETIIAINTDPDAPIFKQCDYYIVGTVEDVVPQLVKALEGK